MTDYRIHPSLLKGKTIGIGVTGGISVYKSCEVVRRLVRCGAEVRVIMTRNASRFVSPMTFSALAGNKVIADMWDSEGSVGINHTKLADEIDILVIVPATANIIGKYAAGIADDFLSTLMIAVDVPLIFAPAMNPRMYANFAVQENISRLQSRGISFVEPGFGDMACGHLGQGRLADIDVITDNITYTLGINGDFKGKRLLITAGPSREFLDPVRFISNRSTGLMGYALAAAAADRGGDVKLISGPSCLVPHHCVETVRIQSAREMCQCVLDELKNIDVLIMAAAVADWCVRDISAHKMKKGNKTVLKPDLIRTPDILSMVAEKRSENQIIMGFAAETDDIIKHAHKKLIGKKLDLLFANDVSSREQGFETDSNSGTILHKSGRTVDLPRAAKRIISDQILDEILTLF